MFNNTGGFRLRRTAVPVMIGPIRNDRHNPRMVPTGFVEEIAARAHDRIIHSALRPG
nr:hypothetical protein [Paracoccus saliphilus]